MNLLLQKILAWPICLIFLIGMIFAGDNNVLCIGDNGHVKFATFCLPCCGEAEEVCNVDIPDDLHNEHSDCSGSSHVELNGPLWSRRIQKTDSNQFGQFASELTINAYLSLIYPENGSSRIIKFYLAYGQSPPSYSITTTVLRC